LKIGCTISIGVKLPEDCWYIVRTIEESKLLTLFTIGREILLRQSQQGWGAKVIDRLSQDLQAEFPELKGLSGRNLKYMRAFAEAYPEDEFVQQAVAQIPWGHNVVLLDRVKDSNARLWYAQQVTTNGWSRNITVNRGAGGGIRCD
jgi:predicted nuclease of restriction endonuclease-like (RecB) superfamily